jgi:hypothetical protein
MFRSSHPHTVSDVERIRFSDDLWTSFKVLGINSSSSEYYSCFWDKQVSTTSYDVEDGLTCGVALSRTAGNMRPMTGVVGIWHIS